MSQDLLVLRQADGQAAEQAKRYGLQAVVLESGYAPEDGDARGRGAWQRALFVAPGTAVPWRLVGYGLHFIERWDVAAPLWRYGVLAKDVGSPAERERTAGSAEVVSAQQAQREISHVLYVAGTVEIARGDLVEGGGIVARVLGVRNPSQAGHHLEVDCREMQGAALEAPEGS